MDNCKKIGQQQRDKFTYINKLNHLSKSDAYEFKFAQN
jgi:hypothetical protein